MDMEGLEVNHISKDFLDTSGKTFHALRDISFTWAKGENISFTGESGSGCLLYTSPSPRDA